MIITAVVGAGAFWIASIVKCEILTSKHYEEFVGLDESTNIVRKSEFLKVLDYSNMNARVYYYDHEGGVILKFVKKDAKWVYDEWEKTVWSRTGSADDYMWPYIR